MEKIRLKSGTIFLVPPMKFHKDSDSVRVSVLTELNYLELESILEVNENLEKIQYLADNDEVLSTYADCIKYTKLEKLKDAYEDENGLHDMYYIEISCDETKAKIKNLQNENDALKVEVQTLKELVDTLLISNLEV